MLRRLAVTGFVLVLVSLSGLSASAAPVDDATAVLKSDSVYLDPAAKRLLDVAALRNAIGSEPIKIAVLPAGPGVSEVRVLPRQMSSRLPGNTIAVIAGRYFYAGSEVTCTGVAGKAAANAIKTNESQLDTDENSDITKALTDFVTEVRNGPKCPTELGRADRYVDEAGGGEVITGVDDTATVLPWVIGGVTTGALLVAICVLVARRRVRGEAAHHRAEANELVERLGAELTQLPADGPEAADARARHGKAEAILLGATTDEHFAAAGHAALEGLTAARAARVAHGLPPGPSLPAFPPAQSAVAGETVNRPAPDYVPGMSYFHPGGVRAARGWYAEPFWEQRVSESAD